MKRFFKSVLRNIRRNVLFSAINLSGLVLGFVCFIIITIWIKNELSYDRFHENSKNIYRVNRYFYDANGAENLHLSNVAPVVAPLMKKEFSGIQEITRIVHNGMVFSYGNQKMAEKKVCFAEPSVIKIFTFKGLPVDSNLLVRPLTVIISDEMVFKYFQNNEAIGKTLGFKDERGVKHVLEITGIFKHWKKSSHFNPDFLISFSTLESLAGKEALNEQLNDWSSNNYETFALIPYLPADMDSKLDAFIDKYLDNGTKWTKIRLEHLTDIHFNWYSSRSYIYIMISIATLILILACINYMNLNAAMYSKQMKDIKIKKIIGASHKALIINLLSESVLFCFLALIIALYVASVTLPFFNTILNNPLSLAFHDNIGLIVGFIAISVLTGLISGIYPVLVLSSDRPGAAHHVDINKTEKTTFRNGLVIFQFTVSIALIISFLLVTKQLNYIHNKALGLDKENIIVVTATPLLIEKLDVFKQQLSQNSDILAVSASKRVPSEGLWDCSDARIISGSNSTPLGFRLANVRIDEHFIPAYKIKLAAGRNYYENVANDFGYIINESAVKKIGWKSPEEALGQVIVYGGRKGSVIGVVKDFHYESLHNPISPIIMYYDPSDFNLISIRVKASDKDKTISFIEGIWQEYNNSDYSFSYEYLSDRYRNLYKSEENTRTIFVCCMILAICIAILGLVGLSVFLTERRTKEIGVRKVNGARVVEVMTMLNKDFLKWVIIAFVIACPIAWYAMHKWLQSFAYKTTLSWWVFAASGTLAFLVALIAVSWQSFKAATRKPVEALRYE
jgi:putative ABC transport system permease protein